MILNDQANKKIWEELLNNNNISNEKLYYIISYY